MDDQSKLHALMASGGDPWEIIGRHLCYCAGIEADARAGAADFATIDRSLCGACRHITAFSSTEAARR